MTSEKYSKKGGVRLRKSARLTKSESVSSKTNSVKKDIVSLKKIGDPNSQSSGTDKENKPVVNKRKRKNKKVIYIEIDDEVTSIYDKIKGLRINNLYLVVPKRAMLFQSIVNLKILKRKAGDLNKKIYIITNDPNGIHLAEKIGLPVYDKLEGHEHPSLVSGKFMDDRSDITPLKASINAFEDDRPMRRKEKKFSITELVKRKKDVKVSPLRPDIGGKRDKRLEKREKKANEKGKLVIVAPNRHALISLVIVSVLMLVFVTYIALPGATITLTPKSNVIESTVNVTLADIEKNRAELDTHPVHVIPSYMITKSINKVFKYQATGKIFQGENASGVITIINKSDHDWPLIVRTRFQTGDGLVFRLRDPVTVPPANGDEPGVLDVTVYADELDIYDQVIGERGNIGPSKFFLPGLSSSNQELIFAENKEPFTSGLTKVIKKITPEDIEAARQKMIADLKASAEAELTAYVNEKNDSQKTSLILLTGSEAIEMSEPSVSIPENLVDQKLESFEVQGEMLASGVAYNRDDLLTILKTELKLKKNPQKRLSKIDDDSLTYRVMEVNKDAGKIKITAVIKGIEEYEISPDKENGERLIKKIKDHILNREIDEAETYIQNLPEIDKVDISSWPAWSPTLPGIPDNINIEVQRAG